MPKPVFPSRGQKSPNFWDDDLQAYVDYGTSLEVVDGGTVALDDTYEQGDLAGYYVTATATFTGEGGELEVEPGVYVFLRTADGWEARAASEGTALSGGGGPVPDPPSAPLSVASDADADSIQLTITPGEFYLGHEVQITGVDGGGWQDYLADLTIDTIDKFDALSPGTLYSGNVRSYNSLGERSASVAWGPVTTDSLTLHDQLLALSPEIYVRFSQGSIQNYGTIPGSWVADNGGSPGTLPALSGPPLTDGATTSAAFTPANTLKRASVGAAIDDAQKLTLIYVAKSNGSDDPGHLLYMDPAGPKFGFGGSETYYEFKTQEHLIVQTIERDGGGTITRQQWRDGVSHAISFPSSIPGATYDVTDLYINGWPFGGNSKNFYLDCLVLVVGEILTQPQAQALAEAAGTYGNGGVA